MALSQSSFYRILPRFAYLKRTYNNKKVLIMGIEVCCYRIVERSETMTDDAHKKGNVMKQRFFLSGLILFSIVNHSSQARIAKADSVAKYSVLFERVLKYAQKHLPLRGKLQTRPDGYSYLKVDDAYVHALFPKLKMRRDGFAKPSYFRKPGDIGAHITVFYKVDHVRPKQVGCYFNFNPKKIAIVRPNKNTQYVVLEVDAPELEALRTKYGRTPKIYGHEFHITLGRKLILPVS